MNIHNGVIDVSQMTSHVDRKTVEPVEAFMGLYSMTETTGRALAQMIEDGLIRSGLSMNNLRGQTYDGAANMAGPYNGC